MSSRGPLTRRRMLAVGLLTGAATIPVVRAFGPADALLPTSAGGGGGRPLPPITYDQGMGQTDSTGLVTGFPLRERGAKQLFVDAVAGTRQFNGLSPYPGYRLNGKGPNHQVGATGRGPADRDYGPAAGYAQAFGLIQVSGQVGEGWQVFLAEGQRFVVDAVHGWDYMRGYSVAYPFCLQSYDPRDPLNRLKHGRAGTAGQRARPELTLGGDGRWPNITRGDPVAYDNWVFRGLTFVNPTPNSQGFGFVYCVNNFLMENCVLNGVQLVLQNENPAPGLSPSRNVIVRRVASFGQYDLAGGHSCGIYSSFADLTVEDCVFYHCGWKIGVDRNTPVAAGGPDIFKHCLYIHGGKGSRADIRRNVMMDGSASGLSMRGAHLCHHNVIVDCPTPDFNSGGTVSDAENPAGVLQRAYCQLVIGGADINDLEPRGQGFASSGGAVGSYYAYSLYVNNPKFGRVNNNWMQVASNVAGQPSYMRVFGNRAYAFARSDAALVKGGSFPQNARIEGADNVTNDRSPARTEDLYRALGFASKEALAQAMIADPMRDWAYLLLAAASRAFGFDFSRTPPG